MTVTLTQRAHGPDMSKYDLSFDPAKATHQLDFAIQRASYRTTKDEAFDTLYPGVSKVPLRMAYHYLASNVDWKLQYDKFMSVVDGKGFLAFVCDFEDSYNTMSVQFAKMAWDFCKQIVIDTGKRGIIYTNKYHYQDWLIPSQKVYNIDWSLADYWIAQYHYVPNPDGQPTLPVGRNTWSLWQYRSNANGTNYGMGRTAEGDLNVFNGTKAQLEQWLGVSPTTPPPPADNPVVNFTVTNGGVTYEALNVELKPKV